MTTAQFPATRIPKGGRSGIVWVISAFVFSLLGWSFIGELDVVTPVRGRVISDGRSKNIQSAVASSVRKIHVKEGDAVRAGDLLFELDPVLVDADVAALREKSAQLDADLARLEAERRSEPSLRGRPGTDKGTDAARNQAQQTLLSSRLTSHAQKILEFRAALESRRAALFSGQSTLAGVEARLRIAAEKELRARPYVDVAMPRFQYLQLQDDVVNLEKEVASQKQANARLVSDIDEAQQRLLQVNSARQAEIDVEINEKRSGLAQSRAELSKAEKRAGDIFIKAPEDGIVQKVSVTTVGANVSTNDVLLVLVPTAAAMVIEILIPNEDNGHLRPGQVVDIKLDAFPFQKYGRLTGRVEWVSPDAELSTDSNYPLLTQGTRLRFRNSEMPQYVYRGKVVAQPQSNPNVRLALGLTAQVDIYTDRRRIIDFFLYPLRTMTEDALRVR